MTDAVAFLIQTVFSVASLLFLLRFLLQAVRADFYNPITQGIVSVTDPVLKPLRTVLPSMGNLDPAAFIAAWASECLSIYGIGQLSAAGDIGIVYVLIAGLFETLMLVLNVFFFSILIIVVLSFISPGSYHPAAQVVNQLTEPLMAPARRLLPATGGLDFSPLIVMLVIGMLQRLLPSLFGSLFSAFL
ncbi:MAG: YggT family protein [Pseudomonadota bacterium]